MTTVIIKQCPTESFSYFQWFLLGLYMLDKKNEIKLRIKVPLIDRLLLFSVENKYIVGGSRRIFNKYKKNIRCNLIGEVIDNNGKKHSFAIDSKDSPFIFNVKHLISCDAYFKNQCPIEFDKRGFKIAKDIYLPWSDVTFDSSADNRFKRREAPEILNFTYKIHPGMIGPRRLGWTCRYKTLKKSFDNLSSSFTQSNRKNKLTAYFGSCFYPTPTQGAARFDLDWESDLMAFLGADHTHPNTKREKAVRYLNKLGDGYDARLIIDRYGKHHDLVVPLEEFALYLNSFEYNLNISGFRLSIPNRFIESFIAGTAIVTDTLAVKWFQPFDEEVIETVNMGYEKDDDVCWTTWTNMIKDLPQSNPAQIRCLYERKWGPEVFAKYVISTTLAQ